MPSFDEHKHTMDSPSANNDSIAPSYFGIAKPISIPNNALGRINTGVCSMPANEGTSDTRLIHTLRHPTSTLASVIFTAKDSFSSEKNK